MLSGKITKLSIKWLLALAAGIVLAVAISITSADKADAAPLNTGERFLANKRLWFEPDYDRDSVCHLYDIRRGTPGTPVHLRVIDFAYPINPFTGQCDFRTPLSPSGSGVGTVNLSTRILTIRFPSGAVQNIRIGNYYARYDALAIRRSFGPSLWLGCNSPNNPFC